MPDRFQLEGGRQVLDALAELPKTVQRSALRRTLKTAITPIANQVKSNAPVLWGDLEEDLHIGTKLNKRQRSLNRADKSTVELHFGTVDPAGLMNEFGNSHQRPNPFFRSAWEGGKRQALATISRLLGENIIRGATRFAKRGGKR